MGRLPSGPPSCSMCAWGSGQVPGTGSKHPPLSTGVAGGCEPTTDGQAHCRQDPSSRRPRASMRSWVSPPDRGRLAQPHHHAEEPLTAGTGDAPGYLAVWRTPSSHDHPERSCRSSWPCVTLGKGHPALPVQAAPRPSRSPLWNRRPSGDRGPPSVSNTLPPLSFARLSICEHLPVYDFRRAGPPPAAGGSAAGSRGRLTAQLIRRRGASSGPAATENAGVCGQRALCSLTLCSKQARSFCSVNSGD